MSKEFITLENLAYNIKVCVNESYQAPDAWTCPVCGEITLEGNGIGKRTHTSRELMRYVKHKEDCAYVQARNVLNGKA